MKIFPLLTKKYKTLAFFLGLGVLVFASSATAMKIDSPIFLNGFVSTASSTITGNLNITGNSTTTNATTTRLAITGLGQGWLFTTNANSGVDASTSPTVNYLTATSTLAASTFPYASTTALTVSGKSYVVGSAVGTTPSSVADLIINDNTSASIQLIGGTTATQYILFGDTDNDVGAIGYDHTNDLLELTVGTANIVDFSSASIGLGTSTQASTKVEIGGTQVTNGGDNGTGEFLNLSGLLSFNSSADVGSMIKIQPTVSNTGSGNTFFGVNVDPRTVTSNTSQISGYASYRAAEETTNTFGTSSIGYLYGNHPGGTTDYGFYSNSADINYFGGTTYLANNTALGWLNNTGSLRTLISSNTSNDLIIKPSDSLAIRFMSSNGAFELGRLNQTNYSSFGMGTTSPAATLAASSSSSVSPALMISQQSTGDIFQAYDGSTLAAIIKDGGNMGVGLRGPGVKLAVNGNLELYGGSFGINAGINIASSTALALNTIISSGDGAGTTGYNAGNTTLSEGGDTATGSGAGTAGNGGTSNISGGGDNERATGNGGNAGNVNLAAGGSGPDLDGNDGIVSVGNSAATGKKNASLVVYGTTTSKALILNSSLSGYGITSDSVDGSDTGYVSLSAAGYNDATRGGSVSVFGNEFSGFSLGGFVLLKTGNGSDDGMIFQTGASSAEAMRITGDQLVGIGTTTPRRKLSVQGADNGVASEFHIPATSANITTADTFVEFTSTQGSIGSIAGTAVSGIIAYNTFTGSHYTKIVGKKPAVGMLLEATGEMNEKYKHLSNSKLSCTKRSKAAYGVYGGTTNDGVDTVLAVGAGKMWVVNTGKDLEAGDLLMSSDVCGMTEVQTKRQWLFWWLPDDLVGNYTVGKVMENVKWKRGEKARQIGVVYLAG